MKMILMVMNICKWICIRIKGSVHVTSELINWNMFESSTYIPPPSPGVGASTTCCGLSGSKINGTNWSCIITAHGMGARSITVHWTFLPNLVSWQQIVSKLQSCKNSPLISLKSGWNIWHLEAQTTRLQRRRARTNRSSISHGTPSWVLKGHKTLWACHSLAWWVQCPCHPSGWARGRVPEGEIDGVCWLIIIPVEKWIQHGKICACTVYFVVVESLASASLLCIWWSKKSSNETKEQSTCYSFVHHVDLEEADQILEMKTSSRKHWKCFPKAKCFQMKSLRFV